MHEVKHHFGGLVDGGNTCYEGVVPEPDASKGYDWMVQWSFHGY